MKKILALLLAFSLLFTFSACSEEEVDLALDVAGVILDVLSENDVPADAESIEEIPPFSDEAYVAVNGNVPFFVEEEYTTEAYEHYSKLDSLGRCGMTMACIGVEIMPTEERGSIGSVKPSGWQSVKYDIVDGKYLYNRCHLIGFQLAGENANKRNLITGTRYLNIEGMLPFENMVADHVKEEDHHVLYRITPVYYADNLVCTGVQMEGYCVECGDAKYDEDKFMFHVYCYNLQPGVQIDYATGYSEAEDTAGDGQVQNWILNTSSKKFHESDCSNAASISEKNRDTVKCTREELIRKGYEPCGICKP